MTLPSDLTTHPFPNNQRQFDSEFFRLMMQAVVSHGSAQGIAGASTDLAATAAASGLTINVAAGRAFVKGSERSTQGSYFVCNDVSRAVTCAAANATNPRIDRVVLRVYDSDTTAASSKWAVEVVSGTATAGATLANLSGAASVPANSLLLYNVLVPAAFTGPFVAGTHFQDRRFNVPVAGRELFNGYVEGTSDSAGAGDKLTLPVIGDGVTPVVVSGQLVASSSGAAGTTIQPMIRDAAAGAGTLYYRRIVTSPAVSYLMNCDVGARVPAFSGSKTFYLYLDNSAGTPTAHGNSTNTRTLYARWGG